MILATQFSYFKKGNIFGERNMYKPQLLKKLKYSTSIKNMCHITLQKKSTLGVLKISQITTCLACASDQKLHQMTF